MRPEAPIESVSVDLYRIPTDTPESDGTLEWDSTTMVVVEIGAGDETGIGYSYTDASAGLLVKGKLASVLQGRDALATRACWHAMVRATRNLGRPGIVSSSIAACDVALHDLKARLLGLPAVSLLGARRRSVPVYGSGGFTSYSERELCDQLGGWASQGLAAVKMKIGRETAHDPARIAAARRAIGDGTALFVDANGAFDRKQALAVAAEAAQSGVSWFEEPVSQNDLDGLRLIRDHAPPGMEIASGEYAYDLAAFRLLLDAGAVDVLQADATRCAGFTEFLLADALAHAHEVPLSSHTAPALHLHCCCAALQLRNVEWFFDHVRIETLLFDGAPELRDGRIAPDLSRPGLGLDLKRADAEPYRISM